jgi:hypothetical protein
MTTYTQINERVEARRKEAGDPEKLLQRAYAQNDKPSSCISTDDHQTHVDRDIFGGKVQESLRQRTTEFDGLQLAGGKLDRPETQPLIEKPPNKYTHKKRCNHPDHQGDRWVNRSQFSADKRHSDGLQACCKVCRARDARLAYTPKWRRGT